jgi:hypothetical protein
MIVRLLLGAFLVVGGAGTASGQLLATERLALTPVEISGGPGVVRLKGMGGFEAAVPDANYKLNLHDFSDNPAGFGDNRDSWSLDIRYEHEEFVERDAFTNGDDIRSNEGVFRIGYHEPGHIGVGGEIVYSEVDTEDFGPTTNDYRVSGFSLVANYYLLRTVSAGVKVASASEDEDVTSTEVYSISHSTGGFRGIAGVAWTPLRGITLGARGDLIDAEVEGESRDGFHTDDFTWERPGWLGSVQGFVDRGRLQGAVDYTKQKLTGEEMVQISWSERFILNPGPDVVTDEFQTFSEEIDVEEIRTRWRLNIVPGKLGVGVAAVGGQASSVVVANPNAMGSQSAMDADLDTNRFVAGLSWTGFTRRLLLAGEVGTGSSTATSRNSAGTVENTRDSVTLRLGGEYLLGETVAGRLGVVTVNQDLKLEGGQGLDDSFRTTSLAVGLGFVPLGGVFQVDLAYDVVLDSDRQVDGSRLAAYAKYLF